MGLVILAFAAIMKMKMDPAAMAEKGIYDVLHKVHKHPEKHKFHIKYYDKAKGSHILINGGKIHGIESSFLVLKNNNGKSTEERESFVPVHRIKEVLHEGKSYWKG
ncbi:MAG: RNA repair domain-containing protein [Nanoarchaeota archaeon]